MAKRTAKKTEDPFAPGHHMGQYYGYTVDPDGRIHVAPGLADKMVRTIEREGGLKHLLETTNAYVAAEFSKLAKDRKDWWKEVSEDYGLKVEDRWTFDGEYLQKTPQPETDK